MKILFALAFLAVAWAVPEPIELPKAALPFVNEKVQVQAIRLPAPAKPHLAEAVRVVETPKAALPQVNSEKVQVQSISLPAPVKPQIAEAVKVVEAPLNVPEFHPIQFQKPDIRPLIVPAEVMRELARSNPMSVSVKTPVFPEAVVPVRVDAPEAPKVGAVKVVDLPAPLSQVASGHVKVVDAPVFYKPVRQDFLR